MHHLKYNCNEERDAVYENIDYLIYTYKVEMRGRRVV